MLEWTRAKEDMMALAERRAEVVWEGDLFRGGGRLSTRSSGVLTDQAVTWAARTEQPDGKTSPEELLAAAHASCYSMALSNTMAQAGSPPERLQVTATCSIDRKPEGGIRVSTMRLHARGRAPGIDQARFEELAREGERNCPISNAIRGNVEIQVSAELES